jgi:hypothetical protein
MTGGLQGADVLEQDGEYSAECKTCGWHGPEYKRKELAEESANTHNRDSDDEHHRVYNEKGHWYTR